MTTASRQWTVLTWNLQGSKPTDLERVAEVIRGAAPDAVSLQEVRRPQARELAERLSMSHAWAQKHNPFRPFFGGRAEGAALLTPHTLSDSDHARVSDADSKRSYRRRIALWAIVTRSDRATCRIVDVHLSPHDLRQERLDEAARITAIVDRLGDTPPIIVAGDLNNHEQPEVIEALPGVEFVPAPPTNPSEAPVQRLDHVLLPADSTGVEVFVPDGNASWAELSDHLPVTARFSLQWCDGAGSDTAR